MEKEEEKVVSVPAIEDFEEIYNSLEERKDWEMLMLYVQTSCEQLLRGKVQASVTSRVKSWDSLRKKLTKRHSTKNYAEAKDIQDDLTNNDDKLDIIGARIRAFFPKQLKAVYEIIRQSFTVSGEKTFSSDYENKDKLPAFSENFGNYEGIHYWVEFKGNDNNPPLEPRLWERFKSHKFEIQVRSSMLLDGWAEVRHDVIYKALGGLPDRSERVLLDVMKGAVKTMEVLLDHLLDVHEDRIKSDDTKFESMELFEQALVRALPQLSQLHEGIEDVEILHHFLKALQINTSGDFKTHMRTTHFVRDIKDFQKTRAVSKVPVWAFILYQIFMTLPRETIHALIEKVPESNDLNQIFCLSIRHLEQYLFSPQQQGPLKADEIERCTVFWNLHEYICATWPKSKSKIPTLIENLFVKVIASPVPRADRALFVAFAETLYTRQHNVLGNTLPILKYLGVLYDTKFRWHRHDEFSHQFDIFKQFDNNGIATGSELLEIGPVQLRGAILHRAVCHPDGDENMAIVKVLLNDPEAIDINFANEEGQSTLHVAIIFSPTIATIELLLEARADVNKADRLGGTSLLMASVFRKIDLLELLLNHPEIDVNLEGWLSGDIIAIADRYFDLSKSLRPVKAKFCSSEPKNLSCKKLGCEHCSHLMSQRSKSLVWWYVQGQEWPELERITRHPSFVILKSFRSWGQFLDCIAKPTLTEGLRTILWEKARGIINELDSDGCHLLGCVLRHVNLGLDKELVRGLLDAEADASLPERRPSTWFRECTHMLVSVENMDIFGLVFDSMSTYQLMTTDDHGRTLLHLIARGRMNGEENYLVKLNNILLKSAGHDKLRLDIQGRTWVHHAIVSSFSMPVVGFLERCLADDTSGFSSQLVASDNDGWTPLHWLCYAYQVYQGYDHQNEWKNRLHFLLQCRADPDQACNHGWTPRLILLVLKGIEFYKCRKLLPQLVRDHPLEELQFPNAVLSAFRRGGPPNHCSVCNIFRLDHWTSVLASQTIALEASDSDTTFQIHEHLLRSISPILLAACSREWNETTTGRYKFHEDVTQQVLLCCLTWAYYGDSHNGNEKEFITAAAEDGGDLDDWAFGSTPKNQTKKGRKVRPWILEPEEPLEQPVAVLGEQKQEGKAAAQNVESSSEGPPLEDNLHPLLLHIKLYVFAGAYQIEPLKMLSKQEMINKLQELGTLEEGHERAAVVDVLKYAFSSNLPEQDAMLHWLARFASWRLDELKQMPSNFDKLLLDTDGNFATLLVRYVQKSSLNPFTMKPEDVMPRYPIPRAEREYSKTQSSFHKIN